MRRLVLLTSAIPTLLALTACNSQGSAEKAGEKVDSAIEETTQGKIDRKDGALENAGEAVDKATGHENDDPIDAINDAAEEKPDAKT